MTDRSINLISKSADSTMQIGAQLAQWLQNGDVVLLHGDLGAGKTTLAKGIATALRVDAVVSSPSFALVNEYETGLAAPVDRLYHLDLYRLMDRDDLDSIGFAELIAPVEGVALVEWPERALDDLPERYVLVEIASLSAERRHVRISPGPDDTTWRLRMEQLSQLLKQFEG